MRRASISLERENRNKLILEPGIAMNARFLTALNKAYDTVHDKYSEEFKEVHRITTSNETNPASTAEEVARLILPIFLKK
jgi:hypothetical protein